MLANKWIKTSSDEHKLWRHYMHHWTFVKFGPFCSEPSFLLFMCSTASHQKAI